MRTKETANHISTIAVLIVFCILAFCVLYVLISGAGVYKSIVDRTENTFSERVLSQYIQNKIHSAGSADAISIEELDGTSMFCIEEEIDGEAYKTCIYSNEGYLQELFLMEGEEPDLSSGEKITSCAGICFHIENGLLKTNITKDNGEELELYNSLRFGGVV